LFVMAIDPIKKKVLTKMNIVLVSDLHLDFAKSVQAQALRENLFPVPDILVVAGDISTFAKRDVAVEWLQTVAASYQHVIFVLGNHDYWHGNGIDEVVRWWRQQKIASNVHFLERDVLYVADYVFVGTTLWSDVSIRERNDARRIIGDYRNIPGWDPILTSKRFQKNAIWLHSTLTDLRKQENLQVVVVTHHLPTVEGIDVRYAKENTNTSFFSGLLDKTSINFLGAAALDHIKPIFWCCGHTHVAFHKIIGDFNTRVVCNPNGYPHEYSHLSTTESGMYAPATIIKNKHVYTDV
jgi:Icc-related predicted phosphoesterase